MDLPRDKVIPWGAMAKSQAIGIWEGLLVEGGKMGEGQRTA
jgi:hypothetical protein